MVFVPELHLKIQNWNEVEVINPLKEFLYYIIISAGGTWEEGWRPRPAEMIGRDWVSTLISITTSIPSSYREEGVKDGTRNDEEESPVPRTVLSAPLRSASLTVMIIEERDDSLPSYRLFLVTVSAPSCRYEWGDEGAEWVGKGNTEIISYKRRRPRFARFLRFLYRGRNGVVW